MFHVFEYPSDEHECTAYGAKAICETCGARVESNNGDVKLHRSPGYAETSAINHWNTRANECDRDELLKVADEIEADAEHIAEYLDSCEGNFTKDDADEYYKLAGWHDRIRKALGVE